MLTLTFKGHVVAPTFKFSDEIIDFGKVSYKFDERRTVWLQNTSEVDINYVIRVPGDDRNQFKIKEAAMDGLRKEVDKCTNLQVRRPFWTSSLKLEFTLEPTSSQRKSPTS